MYDKFDDSNINKTFIMPYIVLPLIYSDVNLIIVV